MMELEPVVSNWLPDYKAITTSSIPAGKQLFSETQVTSVVDMVHTAMLTEK